MNAHLQELRQKLREGVAWVDAQPLRQRGLLLLATLVLLFAGWDLLLMRGVDLRVRTARDEQATLEKQLRTIELRVETLSQAMGVDPDVDRRRQEVELERQLVALDAQLGERAADLIPPREMVRVLKELLGRETELRLERIETLDAIPLHAQDGDDLADAAGPRIFEHVLEMDFRGGYLSTLRYLQAIEALPWRFHWDALEYQVEEYPQARVRLRLLSLSTEEGWIGV